MRLTQYTDFSLRVLIYLGLKGQELSTIQSISEAYGISRNHLMKVVQQLTRTGYVESVRGQHGGLRLKMAPTEIRLGALVKEMEPDLALVECFRENNQCVITPACILPRMLNEATRAFFDVLDGYTLEDLLAPRFVDPLRQLLRLPTT